MKRNKYKPYRLVGYLIGMSLTLLGLFAWIYIVMYQWVWLDLMGATTIGATVGLTLLFILFGALTLIGLLIVITAILSSLHSI
jgi:DMSO/TMAO reductase YedYZ heme-binding membrane subunit